MSGRMCAPFLSPPPLPSSAGAAACGAPSSACAAQNQMFCHGTGCHISLTVAMTIPEMQAG